MSDCSWAIPPPPSTGNGCGQRWICFWVRIFDTGSRPAGDGGEQVARVVGAGLLMRPFMRGMVFDPNRTRGSGPMRPPGQGPGAFTGVTTAEACC